MKIGVSSYSFSRLVGSGQMTQLDVVAKTKAMGFDFIEFSGLSLPAGEPAIPGADPGERTLVGALASSIWAPVMAAEVPA